MDINKEFKKVGTHSGRFHADEVMATAILKQVFEIELTRTRDPEILEKQDLIYDIGNGEFDHHQLEKEYRDNGTPYAACGLIWRQFGRQAILTKHSEVSENEVEIIFRYVDAVLIEGIDAVDNGIRTTENIIPTMCISSIIGGYNPTWDSPESVDAAFNDAVGFAEDILKNLIDQKVSTLKARTFVIEAYNNRKRPELLILDNSYPWERTLKEIDINKDVLFVIYPKEEGFYIQTVREYGEVRRDRKRLPEEWAGKREEELGSIIGIKDAIFCHSSRFIAKASSFESILKMADIAISKPEPITENRKADKNVFDILRLILQNKLVIKIRRHR
ncbi:metal-dependent protein hydrolase [Ruminiclostridium papyrosolvens DSM 2782]|uniref:Metal-dependent protein hydrolase n=1 Tax=Ruminiclostridium papyrosolvens DSM 2782 TaxID=588581 RepID=F1TFW4_9FIRM|nr:MYG1 family protein [Ruminiclostridium papyrosolvens]EGD46583.1 metal-dependent protein hydrolase [Ruminiclostridium papyrosolvens DSM 2782]WES35733.1 MYG1 family protein [Ruminiclostridium papyrosolvens DSM 2782]